MSSKLFKIDEMSDELVCNVQFLNVKLREQKEDEDGKIKKSFYRCFRTSEPINLGSVIILGNFDIIEGYLASDFIPEPSRVYKVALKLPSFVSSAGANFTKVTPTLVRIIEE